jgi:RHS repeat-associated protein
MVTTPAGVMLDFDELSMLRHHAHPYVDEYYVYTADDERIATLRPGEEERWRLRSLDGAVLEEFRYDSVSGSGCTEPVDVQGVVISSQVEYFACNTLTAGPNVTITATGDATFRSLGSVAITGSFTVQSGGKLTITGDAPLGTPGSLLARKRYLYAAGYLVAMESALQGRAYVVPNWLGSPTVVLDDGSPTTVDTHFDFGFGEELQGSTQSAGFDSDMRFTGHERDYHTHADSVPWDLDLDYMHARHYSPLYGRLLTVDPAYGGSFADPQSWNRYSYARNNPIRFVDPDGRSAVGWVVKILRNRKIMVRPIHSNREFAYLQRQGVDVMATTRARARSGTLSAQRGRGRPVQDPAHPERGTGSLEGRDPHYHMSGRPSGAGHSFWRRGLATVTFSYWASERGATAQGFAGVADLFNPLSLFNDVAELTDLASDPDVLSDLILRIRGGDEELPNGIVTMEFSFSPPFWFFIPLSGL